MTRANEEFQRGQDELRAAVSRTRAFSIHTIDLGRGSGTKLLTSFIDQTFKAISIIDSSHDVFEVEFVPNPIGDIGDYAPLKKGQKFSAGFFMSGLKLRYPKQEGKSVKIIVSHWSEDLPVGDAVSIIGGVTVKSGLAQILNLTGPYEIPSGREAKIITKSPILSINGINVTGAQRNEIEFTRLTSAGPASLPLFGDKVHFGAQGGFLTVYLSSIGSGKIDIFEADQSIRPQRIYTASAGEKHYIRVIGTTNPFNHQANATGARDMTRVRGEVNLSDLMYYVAPSSSQGFIQSKGFALFVPYNLQTEFRASAGQVINGENYIVELS